MCSENLTSTVYSTPTQSVDGLSAAPAHLSLCRGLQVLSEGQQVVLQQGHAATAAVQTLAQIYTNCSFTLVIFHWIPQ